MVFAQSVTYCYTICSKDRLVVARPVVAGKNSLCQQGWLFAIGVNYKKNMVL